MTADKPGLALEKLAWPDLSWPSLTLPRLTSFAELGKKRLAWL